MTEEEFTLSICVIVCDKDFHFIPERINNINDSFSKLETSKLEILIIDNTEKENIEISNSRIKIKHIKLNENKGPWFSRLYSSKVMTKNFIWFIDVDDKISFNEECLNEILKFQKDALIRFNYYYKGETHKNIRITNYFIPKRLMLSAYFNFKKEMNTFLYLGEDDTLREYLCSSALIISELNEILYYVNTTETAGSFSKPKRTIEDYELLLKNCNFTFIEKIKREGAKVFAEYLFYTIISPLKDNSISERIQVIEILYRESKLSKQTILDLFKEIVKNHNEYNWLLSSTKSATLESEHK